MDAGHKYADDELKKLERRIRKQYKQAHDEMSQKLLRFANKFNVEDAKRQKLLQQGKITKKQYQQWRERQIFQGKRWRKMEQNLANDMANARNIAQSMTDNTAIDVYALNYNYGGFEVENGIGGFTNFALYDRNTVQRLMRDNPQLLKPMGRDAKKALAEGRIKRWNKQKLQSVAMQGIVQGESIPNIARRMADTLTVINRASALRDARTMITAAENSGRLDSYKRAEEMGIEMQKMWLATEDARTRDTHRDMNGTSIPTYEWFMFPDGMLEYPADPAGPAGEVYNCRCTLVASFGDDQDIDPTPTPSDTEDEDWDDFMQWAKDKHEGKIPKDPVLDGPIKTTDVRWKRLLNNADKSVGEYLPVPKLDKKLSGEEIVNLLGGGDLTTGSCQSLALCYTGQRQGFDVLDFRGNESTAYFSRCSFFNTLADTKGMVVHRAEGKSSITVGNRLLHQCEEGNEYFLSVGRHAAMVRKHEGAFQYLEMQSATSNGWKDFGKRPRETFKWRFGCSDSHKTSSFWDGMINITESDFDTDEFRSLLGFINTKPSKQMKGSAGGLK